MNGTAGLTACPAVPELTELSLDRMAGRLKASGRVVPGSAVHRIVLSYGPRSAETAPVPSGPDAGAWSIALDLGPPLDGVQQVQLSWSGAEADAGTWTLPLAALRDATPYQCNISRASFCRVTGRYDCQGWGFPAPGSLSLLINGRAVAHSAKRFVRTDVAQRYPWTKGIAAGWALSGSADFTCTGEVAMEVCTSLGAVRIVLSPGHERFKLLNDRGAANRLRVPMEHALWRAIPSLLRRAPIGLHRALLASARFGALWRHAPEGLAAQGRRAIVDSLIDRNGHWQPMWLRLATDDVVLAMPGEDSVISRRFLLEGSYEPGFLRWVSEVLDPGETVIDGGAAFGSFSLVAARAVGSKGQVVAIEANPAMAERLTATLKRNPHGHAVVLERIAIGHAVGRLDFVDVSRSNAGGSRLLEPGERAADAAADLERMTVVSLARDSRGQPVTQAVKSTAVRVEQVDVTTLDLICLRLGLRDVALLKLDIEGAELNAVRGATALLDGRFGVPPIVALEFSRLVRMSGGTPDDLFGLFSQRGWTAWRMARGKDAGGELLAVPSAAAAPEHDNLIFVPPQRLVRLQAVQR